MHLDCKKHKKKFCTWLIRNCRFIFRDWYFQCKTFWLC